MIVEGAMLLLEMRWSAVESWVGCGRWRPYFLAEGVGSRFSRLVAEVEIGESFARLSP